MTMPENPFLYLIALTLVPWIELRGSIPIGLAMSLDPVRVFAVCTFANMLIIPISFLFLDFVFPFFENVPAVKRVLVRTRSASRGYLEKYGVYGLAIFVAIPLPGSGAYSGALAARIFDIEKKKAFYSIAVGVVMAGIIVTVISVGLLSIMRLQ